MEYINFCANNYLGLANDLRLRDAARSALDELGYGMASVRFICGTQGEHRKLETDIASFLEKEDAILYSSCFDANTGLFETILDSDDAIISDSLNHASIIDGVRLFKGRRLRYANNDMAALESCLREASDARVKLIATDGVFSMDGIIADLPRICDLAEKYGALVMVDDSHATGVIGKGGRGTPDYHGVADRIDIMTGTLGKALGGASGGYTSGPYEVIEWLRQRSRPYLFSNALMPAIVRASIKALELVRGGDALRAQLMRNADRFRMGLTKAGFRLGGASHPIIPVMLGEAVLAKEMAQRLFDLGIYVVGFSFPVVPKGEARIRVQMSAAHSDDQIDRAVAAFTRVGQDLGVLGSR